MTHKLAELSAMSREQLEALAKELKIKFNKHTSLEDLGYAVLDAEAKAESLKPIAEKPKRGRPRQAKAKEPAAAKAPAAEQPAVSSRPADSSPAFTVDAGVYEANAGDTVKVKIKATDIKEAFCGIVGRLNVNTDVFSVLSVTPGDTDDPDNENSAIYKNTTVLSNKTGENTEKVCFLYNDLENIEEDTVFVTLELKINDNVKDGTYAIPFIDPKGETMGVQYNGEDENGFCIDDLDPDFLGALIKVGEGSEETIMPEPVEEEYYNGNEAENTGNHATVREYINEETGQPVTEYHLTGDPAAFTVEAGIYEAKAGDTVKLKIRTTDVKEAYNSVLGFLEVDTDKFTVLNVTAGDTDDPDNENSRVYRNSSVSSYMSDEKTEIVSCLFCDIANLNEGAVIATVELKLNDDINDGNYAIPFSVRGEGSVANQIITEDGGMIQVRILDPEFHGALIKVSSVSEETEPENEVTAPAEDTEKPSP